MLEPVQLDFSPEQRRTNVTAEYATRVAEHLKQSPDRHIFAAMQYLPDHLVYLKKEGSRKYIVTIANIMALDPPLQSVVGHSVHDALWLASVPGGFYQPFFPVDNWHNVSSLLRGVPKEDHEN